VVLRPLVPTSSRIRPPSAELSSFVVEHLLSDRNFCRSLSPDQNRDLESLREEGNAELLGEALYSLGQSLEREEQDAAALRVYSALAESFPNHAASRERLQALLGTGPWQGRLEILSRRFVRQATDPAMIFSFGIAGGIASTLRSATLASLALRGPGLLSRCLGARFLAGSAGYLAEVPAFVGAGRLWRSVFGGEASENSWAEDLASAGLFLGVMKFSGFAGGELSARLTRNPLLRLGGTEVSGLGGVYLAHRLQESAGMHPARDEANRWVDSADTYLQMLVGVRLLGSHGASPAVEAVLLRSLQTEAPLRSSYPLEEGLTALRPVAPSYEDPSLLPSPAELSFEVTPVRQQLIDRYGPEAFRRIFPELHGVANHLQVEVASLEALLLRGVTSDNEIVQAGWQRLHYALQHSSEDAAVGSYLNVLLRRLSEEIVRRGDSIALNSLFTELHRGGSLEKLERFAALHLPAQDLFHVQTSSRSQGGLPSLIDLTVLRHAEGLPILIGAKQVLRSFLRRNASVSSRLLDGVRNNLLKYPELASHFDRAVQQAKLSPLSGLRLERALAVMGAEEPWYPKLLELSDPDIRLHGYRWDGIPAFANTGLIETQYDAYLADPRFHNLFREFLNDWKNGGHRLLARSLHYPAAREIIQEIWPTPRPLESHDMILALERLGDSLSKQVAQGLRSRGAVLLNILGPAEFNRLARNRSGGERGDLWSGFTVRGDSYYYPSNTIILRQIQNASPEVFPSLVFERLVTLVHEYDHHVYVSQASIPTLQMLEEEMSAHLRHMQFRLRHGSRQATAEILRRSPLGLAMYLRDRIEATYRPDAGKSAGEGIP